MQQTSRASYGPGSDPKRWPMAYGDMIWVNIGPANSLLQQQENRLRALSGLSDRHPEKFAFLCSIL